MVLPNKALPLRQQVSNVFGGACRSNMPNRNISITITIILVVFITSYFLDVDLLESKAVVEPTYLQKDASLSMDTAPDSSLETNLDLHLDGEEQLKEKQDQVSQESSNQKQEDDDEDEDEGKDQEHLKFEYSERNQLFEDCEQSPPSNGRYSEQPTSVSSVKSLFNCFLPDSLCTYFYPANFFEPSCGLGRDYTHFVNEAKEMKENRTLWMFMPSVGFPTLTLENVCLTAPNENGQRYPVPPFDGKNKNDLTEKSILTDIGIKESHDPNSEFSTCTTERLSFLHVHKAGGSSLHEGFNYISRSKSTSVLVRHRFFTPSKIPLDKQIMPAKEAEPSTRKAGRKTTSMQEITLKSLGHATKYPEKEFKSEQHVIFAVVRDPIERFISSIGQAMGAAGSGGNHVAKTLRDACIKDTPAATLKCVAKYVQTHGFWIELHFTPQVIDIAFTTMWQDVPLAIFSFRDLKTVLNYFGRGNTKVRDGSSKNYRSDEILTNMTVADYDDETLQIVCEIYKMDVIMQRDLGMEIERCDPFIPK
mmetsp:Transcript_6866/g.8668  ORF Transcript_6866/g.8668 Transcript_6866/m.8668 type:complete len:533 (+) Transcript_6866:164-1762(+)